MGILDKINIFKHLGKALDQNAKERNDANDRVGGTLVGVSADLANGLGGGLTQPQAAVPGAIDASVGNLAKRAYNFDSIADELAKHGGFHDRKELRAEFEKYVEENPKFQIYDLKSFAKAAGETVIGRDDDASRSLEGFKAFKYAGGNINEFESLNKAANTKYSIGPDINEYTEYKQALKDNPALVKRQAEYPLKQAIADGATIGEYTGHLRDNELGELKKEKSAEKKEIDNYEKENKAEEKRKAAETPEKDDKSRIKLGGNHRADASEEAEEQKGNKENDPANRDMETALAQAKSVDTTKLAMTKDDAPLGISNGYQGASAQVAQSNTVQV